MKLAKFFVPLISICWLLFSPVAVYAFPFSPASLVADAPAAYANHSYSHSSAKNNIQNAQTQHENVPVEDCACNRDKDQALD